MTTIFATMIPFAIIIVIPVLFLIGKGKKHIFNFKATNWLLMIYIGILFVSLLLVMIIRPEELTTHGEREEIDLYEMIYKGKRAEVGPAYLLDENSYKFEEETLTVTTPSTNQGSEIFVERKKENDGKIDVHIYGNELFIDGKDFSDNLISPSVKLDGENLKVVYPEYQEIKIAMAKNEFPINQFTGKSYSDRGFDYVHPIIYLQIPQNVELTENPAIQYINQ